tara:strand:+ start:167 stop:391 length:225 start_codon:yes stop_codon:yes gene_type:complete
MWFDNIILDDIDDELTKENMNRAARRRAKSKSRGATQLHHPKTSLMLQAEIDEKLHNKAVFQNIAIKKVEEEEE